MYVFRRLVTGGPPEEEKQLFSLHSSECLARRSDGGTERLVETEKRRHEILSGGLHTSHVVECVHQIR